MKRGFVVCAAMMLGAAVVFDGSAHAGKDPVSIKVIMQKAMKGKLCGSVILGTASDDDKKQLIALFKDLGENKPPKGAEDDWKKRTKALLDAATKDDPVALKKAANCTECHAAHRPRTN
jgi:hypothetical protein